jgi:hypothetical protein
MPTLNSAPVAPKDSRSRLRRPPLQSSELCCSPAWTRLPIVRMIMISPRIFRIMDGRARLLSAQAGHIPELPCNVRASGSVTGRLRSPLLVVVAVSRGPVCKRRFAV